MRNIFLAFKIRVDRQGVWFFFDFGIITGRHSGSGMGAGRFPAPGTRGISKLTPKPGPKHGRAKFQTWNLARKIFKAGRFSKPTKIFLTYILSSNKNFLSLFKCLSKIRKDDILAVISFRKARFRYFYSQVYPVGLLTPQLRPPLARNKIVVLLQRFWQSCVRQIRLSAILVNFEKIRYCGQ